MKFLNILKIISCTIKVIFHITDKVQECKEKKAVESPKEEEDNG